jgi:hypothetical protein
MTEKIVFDASLYPKYEVEILGQIFQIRAVNRAVFEILSEMARKANAGDPSAIAGLYDQVGLVVDAPKEFLDALDFRLIRDVVKFINEKLVRGAVEEEQKNASGSGEAKQPS